jgi:hypothetical protein
MSQLMDSSISRQFDRLPPHSVEAEMCMLASMMLDVTKDMTGQIVQMVTEESFFQADHQILFKTLKELYEAASSTSPPSSRPSPTPPTARTTPRSSKRRPCCDN